MIPGKPKSIGCSQSGEVRFRFVNMKIARAGQGRLEKSMITNAG